MSRVDGQQRPVKKPQSQCEPLTVSVPYLKVQMFSRLPTLTIEGTEEARILFEACMKDRAEAQQMQMKMQNAVASKEIVARLEIEKVH